MHSWASCLPACLAACAACTRAVAAGGTHTDTGDFNSFLTWARKRGAIFEEGLRLADDPITGLRGLLAGAALAAGSDLVSLPAGMLLTDQAVQSADGHNFNSVQSSFALFILKQRANGGEWQPYFSRLPESFEHFPMFYSDAALDGFQASGVRSVITWQNDLLLQDYELAKKQLPELTLDNFRWARCAVKSRVFSLKSLSTDRLSEETIAMVPLGDFLNHPVDGVVEANVEPSYDVDSGTLSFKAIRDIKKDEGIYWDYGFNSNRHSLLRYGFVSTLRIPQTDMPLFFNLADFDGQPHAGIQMKSALISSATAASRLKAHSDGTVFTVMHELSLKLTGREADRLLGHMRFAVLNPTSENRLREICADTYCRPISANNEQQALRRLAVVLKMSLHLYVTSTDEDKALLEGGGVSPSDGAEWDTLVVRYGEKRLLQIVGNSLQAVDSLFLLSPNDLAQEVKAHWDNKDNEIHRYVRDTLLALVDGKRSFVNVVYENTGPESESAFRNVTTIVIAVALFAYAIYELRPVKTEPDTKTDSKRRAEDGKQE